MPRLCVLFACFFVNSLLQAQSIPAPVVVEVLEDDHVATVSWNSLTQTYHPEYDPDKQEGIFSYFVEWGSEAEGFVHEVVTPYRAHQFQPLEPGVTYQARVYALGIHGEKSEASDVVTFQHDPSRVNEMRQRLTGFFDDMNYPMGPFNEEKWNQAYSGCMKIGSVSQHINDQYHGHNVIASGGCDRSFASSRARIPFDFTDRTGTIEFDLDGAHATRNEWYLDLTPASRKNDVTGHLNAEGDQADPAFLLRIQQNASRVRVLMSDSNGILNPIENAYENDACGNAMVYCEGRNLTPLINVRRHWKVELSKTRIRIFIDDILVVDGSLVSTMLPEGLPYEIAQVNWIAFSYNTGKENLVMSMMHWDNFGFDAPTGSVVHEVIHNYSDGKLGTETPRVGNERSVGMVPSMDDPAIAVIPIPDALMDQAGNDPIKAELMFTLQGAHGSWPGGERIEVNGNNYPFSEPVSSIPNFAGSLFSSYVPHSAIVPLDPAHLLSESDNEIKFYLEEHRILNVHIELTYPTAEAPSFSPPATVFADHQTKLMAFRPIVDAIGPTTTFDEIDGSIFYSDEFLPIHDPEPGTPRRYEKQTPVDGQMLVTIQVTSLAQLAAKGTANGIAYYEIWVDEQVVKTVRTDLDHPVATNIDSVYIDTRAYSNGLHELYIQAYDIYGNPSLFDGSISEAESGEYIPTIIDVQNQTTNYHVLALDESISIYPNPTGDFFRLEGDLGLYQIAILMADGTIYQEINTVNTSQAIDLTQLPSGLYFVRLIHEDNQKLSFQKIIKS